MSLQGQILELADRLDSIHRTRVESQFYQAPPFDYEIGVPSVFNMEKLGETQDVGVTHLALSWSSPSDKNIEKFEVWAQNVSFQSSQPYKVADVTDAPATVQLTSDQDTGVVLFIRTILKNGLSTPLASAPTVATSITQTPFTVADESIGDAKLDRTTDPISIVNGDIANAAVSTAKIQNAAITNALIANLAVDNAKINDLAANKLLAGTLVAGVILSSNINATQINAGTMSAVNVSGGTYTLTSSPNVMDINGANGFRQRNTTTGKEIKIVNGQIEGVDSGGDRTSFIDQVSSRGVMAVYDNGSLRAHMLCESNGRGAFITDNGTTEITELSSNNQDGDTGGGTIRRS